MLQYQGILKLLIPALAITMNLICQALGQPAPPRAIEELAIVWMLTGL